VTTTNIHFYLGADAVGRLVEYCEAHRLTTFSLVADRNTYDVLGRAAEAALRARQWDVKTVVLDAPEVVPDEVFITQVLYHADQAERVFVAVGTGTVTDITRFVSHRTRRPFISLPTAPSVDGFTSPSASLILKRIKLTVMSQPPVAVFADLDVLTAAPQPLIAAGFGDILGKAVALADWQLGHWLWDEPYSAEIAQRVRDTLQNCIAAAPRLHPATPDGIRQLMFSLVDSGLCMLDFGNSRPAAGAEHYMSHYLEMKLLREQRPAVLHGAKVALCSLRVAELYARVREMGRAEAAQRLKATPAPEREADIQRIRTVFGSLASNLTVEQAPFLDLSAEAVAQLKARVLDRWDDLQTLAAAVPPPQALADLLRQVGGATEPAALTLAADEVDEALVNAHYIRNRFTICKLSRLLGLLP
jgi:glycerol-1-phosphate dehydrogenase [NAD(P)+]